MKVLNFTASEQLIKLISSRKLANIVFEDGEWAVGLKDSELATLGYLISNNKIDEEVNPIFEEESKNPFIFNQASKSIFIAHLSNIWESESSVEYAQLALEEVESYEIKFNKSLLLFSEDETVQTINSLGDRFSFYGLKFRIKIYKDYYNFYAKEYGIKEKDNLWARYQTTKNLSEILSVDEEERNLTRDDLMSLFNTLINSQQGIIPLMIFEGVYMSRIDERDELRNLMKSDVHTKHISVRAYTDEKDGRGFNMSVDRKLEMDQDVMKCIAKTSLSENMIRINKHDFESIDLIDTPYILRSMKGRRMKEDSQSQILSYGGAYNRFKECRKQMDSISSQFDDFSIKYIANCGKSYYIKRYMEGGMSETEAIIKTLKRFGDWNTNGHHSQEVKLDTNKVRIARLRRSYSMYR